jgi:hypothetical protein
VKGQVITRWELKGFRGAAPPVSVQVDDQGGAWLIAGTDSGYEGRTSLFYTRITATFTPQ